MRDLYLLNFDNNQYGIWEDELLFCGETRYVSQLPMLPDYIAGICSIEKGHSITLADLAVCLGFAKEQSQRTAQALLLTEDKNFAGFCVYGDLEKISVDKENSHLIPDYLKSDVINRCIVFDQTIIPIINIQVLFRRLLNEQYILPKIEACLPDLLAEPIDYLENARLFSCAQQLFACPVEVVESAIPLFRKIVNLPATPDYIAGMIEYHGQLIPVINLAKWLEIEEKKPSRTLLICTLEGHYFGFLVEKDLGKASGELAFRHFPELLQFYCLQHALIIDEKIVPIVDFNLLITSASSDPANHFPVKPHYYSHASTPLKFGKAPITIVPISLLGVNHAIPKEEVEDIFPIVRYQHPLKNYSLVQGMVYYDNEILPVIDLANCFGRRSLVTDDWKMLLIRNGNFRAFVLAEQVFDELILDVKSQQKLPFILESPVIYGCYSHEANVDLILNIEAIITHADKSVVIQFFDSYNQRINRSFIDTISESLNSENLPQKLALMSGLTRPASIISSTKSRDNELTKENCENRDLEGKELNVFDIEEFLEKELAVLPSEAILSNELEDQVEDISLNEVLTTKEIKKEIFKTNNFLGTLETDDFLGILAGEVEDTPLEIKTEEELEELVVSNEKAEEVFDADDFLGILAGEVEDTPLEIKTEEKLEELVVSNEKAEEVFDADDFLEILEEEVEETPLEIKTEEELEELPVSDEKKNEVIYNAGDFLGALEKEIDKTFVEVKLNKEDKQLSAPVDEKDEGVLVTLDLSLQENDLNIRTEKDKDIDVPQQVIDKKTDTNDVSALTDKKALSSYDFSINVDKDNMVHLNADKQTLELAWDKSAKSHFGFFSGSHDKNIYYVAGTVFVLCATLYYFYETDNKRIEEQKNKQINILSQSSSKKQKSSKVILNKTKIPLVNKKTTQQENITESIEKKISAKANIDKHNNKPVPDTNPKNKQPISINHEKISSKKLVEPSNVNTSENKDSTKTETNKQYFRIKIMLPTDENIKIPSEGEELKKCYSIKYTIKPEDTLWSIAERFTGNGYNYKKIAHYNHIKNMKKLYWGTTIIIKNLRNIWCVKK